MFVRISGVALLLVALASLTICAGCGSGGEDTIVARVGRTDITYTDLMQKMDELPAFTRQQYSGPEGTIEFLNRIVDEEVLYQAALQAGRDTDPGVVRALEIVKRRAVIQAYYENDIEAPVVVPEEDIVAYYNEHDEQFVQTGRVKFRHILVDTRAQAEAARGRVMAGEDFASVARELSKDTATSGAGGLMASVKYGDGVPNAGMSPEFVERVSEWKVGEVTDPLRSDRGWNIALLEDKVEPGTKPLEDVRDLIEQSLRPAKTRERYEEVLANLKAQYRVHVNEDAFRTKPRTEEELFTLAQETEDPLQRLNYYSELVFNYPDGEHAAEAQFMIGFIHAEELNNYEAAENAFRRMKARYPDSELVSSADWMLENMGEDNPPFEEEDVLSDE
jgi:peptidyl-prolyl cis-trans isomerase C